MIKFTSPQACSRVNLPGNNDIENARIAEFMKADAPDPTLYEVHARHVDRIEGLLMQVASKGRVLPDLLEVKVAIEGSCCFGGLSARAGENISSLLKALPGKRVKGEARTKLLQILASYDAALELASPSPWRHPTSRGVRDVLGAVIKAIEGEGVKKVRFDENICFVSPFPAFLRKERYPNPQRREEFFDTDPFTTAPYYNGERVQIKSSFFDPDAKNGKSRQANSPERIAADEEILANDSQAGMLNAPR